MSLAPQSISTSMISSSSSVFLSPSNLNFNSRYHFTSSLNGSVLVAAHKICNNFIYFYVFFFFVKCCRRQNAWVQAKRISVCKCVAVPQEEKIGTFLFYFIFFISGYNLEILLCFKLQIFSTLNSILISIGNWLFVVKYVYEDC